MSLCRALRVHVAASLFLCAASQAAVNIVPKPTNLTLSGGTLVFAAGETVRIYRDAASDSTLPWVEKLFRQAKMPSQRVTTAGEAKVSIVMAPDATLGTEGYKLSITATQVVINAPTLTGQFYAVQSLRQLFPPAIEDSTSNVSGPITLDRLEISDRPRYGYRGVMVDPVRRFLPLNYLYHQVDRLALFKMNRLHLLLSNDQGYRLQSLAYPRLHEVGSPTEVGGKTPTSDPSRGPRWYYTHDEMRALVQYARLRRVEIIPEIDMPGHVGAIVACYPELGVYAKQPGNNGIRTDEEVQISSLHTSLVHPNRQQVLTFVGRIWREMLTIFPAQWYQMGGDEWNYNTTEADFRRFTQEVQDTLTKLGKTTIAWDEVKTAGALRPGNWSQDWHRDNNNGDIISACNYLYLDHRNTSGDGTNAMSWCVNQVTLQTLYSAPLTSNLKGVEGTLFSERLSVYPDYIDRQMWPRLIAVGEIGWVPANNNLQEFLTRLGTFGSRLSTLGIRYFNTPGVTWQSGPLNSKMISLYDRFVPSLISIPVRTPRKRPGKAEAETPQYNVLGREVVFSPSGHPMSLRVFRKP